MRKDWDTYFMDIAHMVATRATCPRRQVGCVIVRNKNIMATGYNGTPPGKPHCIDEGCIVVDGTCIKTIHAEWNAITRTRGVFKYKAYVTDCPCLDCIMALDGTGCREVIYTKPYPRTEKEVFQFCEENSIVIRQHNPG